MKPDYSKRSSENRFQTTFYLITIKMLTTKNKPLFSVWKQNKFL
ncbi:hypothetical protein COH33_05070 [Neisseria meningitidis]|nr:hypothetical protein [Neisseria meningitidis]RPC00020.1 hypothetical protein JY21_04270 [Neisseria meningitidis]RPD18170.1 hypothetical protein JY84_07800 [Neisseria meningitidis]RQL27642.1 hypothetical protein COH33_05070 [Neisseria meningitidis]